MLNDLLGGQRQEYDDFVNRYDRGEPWDDIGDEEALERYRQVSPNLSDDVYRESARDAFDRLTPQQRAEFGRWLQTQARSRGAGDFFEQRSFDDPDALAGASARLHREQPGLLEGLLGGAMGGGALGGAAGGAQTAGNGNLLSSPIAKAVLGGIAAMAASRAMGRR